MDLELVLVEEVWVDLEVGVVLGVDPDLEEVKVKADLVHTLIWEEASSLEDNSEEEGSMEGVTVFILVEGLEVIPLVGVVLARRTLEGVVLEEDIHNLDREEGWEEVFLEVEAKEEDILGDKQIGIWGSLIRLLGILCIIGVHPFPRLGVDLRPQEEDLEEDLALLEAVSPSETG